MTTFEMLLLIAAVLLILAAGGRWARGYDEREDARFRNQARPWR